MIAVNGGLLVKSLLKQHNPAASRGRGGHVSFSSVGSASDGSTGLRVLQTVRTESAGRMVPNAALGRFTVRRAR